MTTDVPPLTPDGDEARAWAEEVLGRPEFDAAEPTPLDRIAQAAGNFLESLFGAEAPQGLGSAILIGAALVASAFIVVAFVIWGRPRAVRRARETAGALFDEHDGRTADALRRDADSRAAAGDWDAAVVLRFRALARGTLERGVVDMTPGSTVQAFARAATASFPEQAAELDSAADAFDDVRYLRRSGTAETYARVARADDAIAAARPVRPSAEAPA